MPPRLKRALPWLVGLALLAWLLLPYRHPDKRVELLSAFARAPWWAFAVCVAGAGFAYLADTFATWLVLAWARVRLSFGEVAVVRGLTYFFAIVNYSLGQAAMILVLARHGVRATRATGVILFIMGINVLVLIGFAGLSIEAGAAVQPAFRTIVFVILAAVPVYLVLVGLRPAVLVRRELFAPLFELGLRGHGAAFLARLPHVTSMMAAHWVTMRCFGIDVPPAAGAMYLPIVFAVAVLPISAQGIGTSQFIAVELFSRYAPGEPSAQRAAVLAYSLFLMAIWVPVQIVIGAICVRTRFGRSLRRAAEEQPLTEPGAA